MFIQAKRVGRHVYLQLVENAGWRGEPASG